VHNQNLFAQDLKSREQDELDAYFLTVRQKNEAANNKGSGAGHSKRKTKK
jgi:hypothetical protein